MSEEEKAAWVGQKRNCAIIAVTANQGGSVPTWKVDLEVQDQLFPDDMGVQLTAMFFQEVVVGKAYQITFSLSAKTKALVGKRPASTEEEKAERARLAAEAKEKERQRAAKEKADYEADQKARGMSDAPPTMANDQKPSASLIKPSGERVALFKNYGFSETQIMVMESNGIIPRNTADAQILHFFEVAAARGLSPITKQIYLLPFKAFVDGQWTTNYAIITGIDGIRSLADKTGQLAGIDEPLFDGMTMGQWFQAGNKFPTYKSVGSGKDTKYVLESGNEPSVCTVVVKRKQGAAISSYTGVATWGEYYPGPVGKGGQWRKMPFVMLAKCAKAQALRDAFPSAISGLYIPEEFDRQQRDVVDVQATVVDMHQVLGDIQNLHTLDELQRYRAAHPEFEKDAEVLEALSIRHQELKAETV